MHATHQPPVALPGASTSRPEEPVTPATLLRQTAAYLWRYGWHRNGFYYLGETDEEAAQATNPPACVAGALRCAVYGHPVDMIAEANLPDGTTDTALLTQAQLVLADEVDGAWRCPHRCGHEASCALEVITDWNDQPDRRLSEVMVACYAAADRWDEQHPHPSVGEAR